MLDNIATKRVESVKPVEVKDSGCDVEVKDSSCDVEYMAVVLNEYYTYRGVEVQWQYNYCTVGGVNYSYHSLIGMATVWGEVGIHRYALMHKLVSSLDKVLGLSGFAFRPHQIGEGKRAWSMLESSGWCLLRHMPRTGKTGTALFALEHSSTPLRVLIVTTKNAVRGIGGKREKDEGWLGFIKAGQSAGWFTRHTYVVSTPHQLHKVSGTWDYVVLDESHKIYSDPKPAPSQYWAYAKHTIGDAKVLYVTATPHAQSINQMYWQLALCRWSPFGNMTWKEYWSLYGINKTVVVGNGRAIPVWTEGKVDEVVELIQECISSLSQESVGFREEMLPVDVPCYVDLKPTTMELLSELNTKEVVKVNGVMVVNMNSRDAIIRSHQVEGSTLKYVDVFSITDKNTGLRIRGLKPTEYNWILGGMEKVQYIKDRWGDVSSLVIMYHYVNEGKLLKREFKNAKVVQGKTHSEGIDLYMYDTMVVYSMDWSVATYIQRRDRQVSLTNRDKPIEVYYLLTKGGVSEDIYKAVVERGEDLTMKYYS